MEIDEYSKYRVILPPQEFFSTWKAEDLNNTSPNLKEVIYKKYKAKAEMLQRDEFKCQNIHCKTPTSRLTMHHVKWQKNGGEHKARNAVTLCRSCHNGFHKAKCSITFNNPKLPPHINTMTFKLAREEKTKDWKKLKQEMGELRTRLKHEGMRAVVSWEDVYILMKWLFDMEEDSIDDD